MKIMIVGGGKVGAYLAAFLLKEGYEVKLIEMRKEEIPQLLLGSSCRCGCTWEWY